MDNKETVKKKPHAKYSVEEYAIAAFLFVMCISILLATFSRYTGLLIMQLTWCEELSRFCMIYICFIGSAVAVSKGSHFTMTAVISATHGTVKKILTFFDYIIATCFFGVIVYYGILQMISVGNSGQISTVMRIPMWIIYAALPIGAIDMAIREIFLFVKTFKDKGEGSVVEE